MEPDLGTAACGWCGVALSTHPVMLSIADRGTNRDCEYQLEIREIERGILASVLALCGVDPKSLSGDVTRGAAVLLRRWNMGRLRAVSCTSYPNPLVPHTLT